MKEKAEKIFQELFLKNMTQKDVQGFKKRYRTLYNEVIIPAMLKMKENEN